VDLGCSQQILSPCSGILLAQMDTMCERGTEGLDAETTFDLSWMRLTLASATASSAAYAQMPHAPPRLAGLNAKGTGQSNDRVVVLLPSSSVCHVSFSACSDGVGYWDGGHQAGWDGRVKCSV
jgi:hypothetical protein